MGDIFDIDSYAGIVEKALAEDGVDGVVFSHAYVANLEVAPTKRLLEASHALSLRYGKPVIPCIIPDKHTWFTVKEETGSFLFEDVDLAMKALSCSLWHHRFHSGRKAQPAKAFSRTRRKTPLAKGFLGPDEAFSLLGTYGVTGADAAVSSADEAVRAARRLRYPVALKTADPGVLHKTEKGGVVLGIRSEAELRKAFKAMKAKRCLVQKMAPEGTEVIIGARRDNEFGHVVLFGLGGVFVELLKDTAMRVTPLTGHQGGRHAQRVPGQGASRREGPRTLHRRCFETPGGSP